MGEEISLEVENATVESLFPSKLRFEGPDGHSLILTRRKKSISLSSPGREIEVFIPSSLASVARRALDAVYRGTPSSRSIYGYSQSYRKLSTPRC